MEVAKEYNDSRPSADGKTKKVYGGGVVDMDWLVVKWNGWDQPPRGMAVVEINNYYHYQ